MIVTPRTYLRPHRTSAEERGTEVVRLLTSRTRNLKKKKKIIKKMLLMITLIPLTKF